MKEWELSQLVIIIAIRFGAARGAGITYSLRKKILNTFLNKYYYIK